MGDRGSSLVVGASSEIGAAIAARLTRAGYRCVLWGRDEGVLRGRVQELPGSAYATVDVTDPASVDRAGEGLPADLTCVVYAAGIFDWARADERSRRSASVIETNLTGAVLTVQRVIGTLIDNAPSHLVLIGSAAATRAFPHNAAYVASKHGLAGYARSLFLEVRDTGTSVSLINPGLVLAGAGLHSPAAAAHPDRLLSADDVARTVEFVVDFGPRGCPVEIDLQPQLSPDA